MKKIITSGFFFAGLTLTGIANAQTTTVSNGNNSGSGSLREALSSNSDTIIINNDVSTIRITETLEYDGTGTLNIIGSNLGQTVDASELSGEDDILSINQGANFNITNLNFIGNLEEVNDEPEDRVGGVGIFVNVPTNRTGTVAVSLDNVSVTRTGSHGVHISDCTVRDECLSGQGSSASINLSVSNLIISRVGLGLQDGDGIRIDERSAGDITFSSENSTFTNVGADGVELDENDSGNITATINGSIFDSNGEFCNFADDIDDTPCDNDGDPDLDDGFDIDEAGSGSIFVSITDSRFINNFDEGLDFDEEDDGNVELEVTNSFFLNNEDQGIRVAEEGDGTVSLFLSSITVADNNQDDEAIRVEEEDDGNVVVEINNSNSIDSNDEGLRIEESGSGSGTLEINDSNFTEFDLDNVNQI